MRFTKWGGGAHWEHLATYLGEDDAGVWLGHAKGEPMTRPGHHVVLAYDRVAVISRGDLGFVASFNEWIDSPDVARCCMYVDITSAPVWGESAGTPEVTMVDLDLDVVQAWTGEVSVSDEDEFASRQDELDYPDEVVKHARHWRDEVQRMVEAGLPPFDGRETRWLDELEGSSAAPDDLSSRTACIDRLGPPPARRVQRLVGGRYADRRANGQRAARGARDAPAGPRAPRRTTARSARLCSTTSPLAWPRRPSSSG